MKNKVIIEKNNIPIITLLSLPIVTFNHLIISKLTLKSDK